MNPRENRSGTVTKSLVLRLTRRRLLGLGALAGASLTALAACAGPPPAPATAPPAPAKAPEPTKPSVGAATATPAPQPTPAATVKPAEKGLVNLTIVITGEPTDLKEELKPFEDRNPGVKVDVIGVAWAGYDEKVDLLIAGGDPPAVWYPAGNKPHTYYVFKGLLAELTPYIQRDKFDITDFHPAGMTQNRIKGKLYGLPAANFPTFIVYNKDLTDRAGITMPTSWDDQAWTWDKYVEVGKAVTKSDPDPLRRIWGTTGFSWRYDYQMLGATLFEKADMETFEPKTSRVTKPDMVAAFQFMQDLIWKYKIQPPPDEAAAFSQANPAGYFVSGKAAMTHVLTLSLVNPMATIKDFRWGIAPFPVNQYNGPRGVLYAGNWVMFDKLKAQEEAWQLFKYVVSPEAIREQLKLEKANRRNGVTQGGMPGRKSLMEEWAKQTAEVTKQPLEAIVEINVKGLDHELIFPAPFTTKWQELSTVGLKPEMDKILLNRTTVAEAVQAMDKKINEILAQP